MKIRHSEYQYLDLLRELVEKGVEQTDKNTGVKTYSKFGGQLRFDLSRGFPLLTTKKVWWKGVLYELYWFLSGKSNIKFLVDNDIHIWDDYPYKMYREKVARAKVPDITKEEFIGKIKKNSKYAKKYGELSHIYGELWRRWPAKGRVIDQVKWVIKEIKDDPDAHNLIVTSWNPEYLYGMAKPNEASRFPICHNMYQLNVKSGKLCLHLYQRSADIFLGVPFNIASYALLTLVLAQVTGYKPGEFIHSFGDVHIYENHIKQAKEQLKRKPKKFPTVRIDKSIKSVDKFKPEHAILENYNPHPPIKAELTVSGGYFHMKIPLISVIVSLDEEGGIGFNGKIPWNISEDLKWFKEKTMGHVVVMGSKTFESIFNRLKKPLPGRTSIIITRQKDFKFEGVITAGSVEKAIKIAKEKEKNGEIFIIGGGQIYNQTIAIADRLYLTLVKGKYGADTFFPDYTKFNKTVFKKTKKSNGFTYTFKILDTD